MEEADVASGRPAGSAADGPQALRYRVIIGEAADDEHACRIEEPSRLLRIWSLLQAMSEEMAQTALPPEAAPRLQRQLQAIRHELETTVSAPLAAELRRAAPPLDGPSSADGLRIECAVLLSWTASLAAQLLNALAATRRRVSRVRAVA